MRSRWDDAEAVRCTTDLALRVYTSRLLGAEPALVLHGGGNTSVKTAWPSTAAREDDVLLVKGSGTDLALATEGDFTPVRLSAVRRLIDAGDLDNAGLMAAVAPCVAKPDSPRPSIETLLHAVLPFKFVEHTHADSVLAITNTRHGARIAAELFGDLAPTVPFHESGFALARACHEVYNARSTPATIGLILLHHGVFAFGDTAQESYLNMLRLVTLAEDYLKRRGAWELPREEPPENWTADEIARLRSEVSRAAGFPLLLKRQDDPECNAFARRSDVAALCNEGPATPQHAVYAKRTPMIGRDVQSYARQYRCYVAAHRPQGSLENLKLDPAPRVVVDRDLGLWTAGMDAYHAGVTGEIFRHDLEIMTRAAAHDSYAGLGSEAILDAEIHYGGFEWRKRQRGGDEIALLGEIVLVTGAADALGHELVRCVARRGGAVAMLDEPAPAIEDPTDAMLSLAAAAPSAIQRGRALRTLIARFGGLDVLVLRPGFEDWLPDCGSLIACAPAGGRIVLIGPATWCNRVRSGATRMSAGTGMAIEKLAVDLPVPDSDIPAMAAAAADLCCRRRAHSPAEPPRTEAR
jgi:rhamnose utilization protein RhaD (predicted bifunctional aldolase and dehydrogenase)